MSLICTTGSMDVLARNCGEVIDIGVYERSQFNDNFQKYDMQTEGKDLEMMYFAMRVRLRIEVRVRITVRVRIRVMVKFGVRTKVRFRAKVGVRVRVRVHGVG